MTSSAPFASPREPLPARPDADEEEPRWAAALPTFTATVAASALLVLCWAISRGLTRGFDVRASLGVLALHRSGLDLAMILVSTLVDPVMAVLLSLAVGFLALQGHRARQGLLLVATTALSGGLTWVLKRMVQRPRPTLLFGTADPGFSFPSWHAVASVAVLGAIALLLARLYPRLSPWLPWLAIALALAIGLSRIYLGAHWPTDVLAGYLVGWILLTGFAAGLDRLERPPAGST